MKYGVKVQPKIFVEYMKQSFIFLLDYWLDGWKASHKEATHTAFNTKEKVFNNIPQAPQLSIMTPVCFKLRTGRRLWIKSFKYNVRHVHHIPQLSHHLSQIVDNSSNQRNNTALTRICSRSQQPSRPCCQVLHDF